MLQGIVKTDGNVLSECTFFEIKDNEYKTVDVYVRELTKKREIWAELNADKFTVKSTDNNKELKLSELINNKQYVIAFIEPDKEPSKHIMADLQNVKQQLENQLVILYSYWKKVKLKMASAGGLL